ncbi:50S ribosomal protein L15 [soil metagenome]
MKPHELTPPSGARTRRTRVGRGESAGGGKTAGRGTKGTKARGKVHPFFEGGQMPLVRRVPKLKGFRPIDRRVYGVVNLSDLAAVESTEIGPDELRAAGLVHKRDKLIKVLGSGQVERAMTVRAHAFSRAAKEGIEAAGGSADVIEEQGPRRATR